MTDTEMIALIRGIVTTQTDNNEADEGDKYLSTLTTQWKLSKLFLMAT